MGAHASPASSGMAPVISPDLAKILAQYEEDMSILAEVKEKLKKLAAGIKNTGNVMLEVIEVFSLFQNAQGSQMRVLSDVDNLDSTLRGKLSAGQSGWNTMGGTGGASKNGKHQKEWMYNLTPKGQNGAKQLMEELHQIEQFIKYEKGLGGKSILDGDSLNNLQKAIDSIKTNFGKAWGDPAAMERDMQEWTGLVDGGNQVPNLKNIQDNFQTINQSVSELSSTTNSRLQFVENEFKQALGMQNSAQQAYQKMNSNTIRHFTNS